MKNGLFLKVLLAVIVAGIFTGTVFGQLSQGQKTRITDIFGYDDETGHHHYECSFLDSFHNPTDWLEMGADIRLRSVWADRFISLNDGAANSKWEFQRYRFRFWQKFKLEENVDFNMRWVWEFRTWDEPDTKPQSWDGDEVIADRMNLTVRNLFGMPLTMVAGRQDIILGDGWLVLDGTPLDGSRTIYFDALRLTYDWMEADTKIDMIYVRQTAESDSWLKPFNDENRAVTEQDEHGVILWATKQLNEKHKLEAYYIYKNDSDVRDQAYTNMTAGQVNAWSHKAEIHTFGGALSGKLDDNWGYRGDVAYQTGDRQARNTLVMNDLDAWGAKAKITYAFNDEWKNELCAGYEYLSGDDNDTRDDEGFDPLWGEWPQWSELYVYTYLRENAIGETNNLQRFTVGHSFKPHKNVQFLSNYHLLFANEDSANLGGSDGFRGQLFTFWLKYSCCKNLAAHALFEYFIPNDYYPETTQDNAFFARLNFEYTF